jgi:maltose O-acetyltransferase
MLLKMLFKILASARAGIEIKREIRRWARLKELGMHIGKDVYLPMSTWIDTSHCYLISIGDKCRFGPSCVILSHDAAANEFLDAGKIGRVIIHESCNFGYGTIILPGVEIGPRIIAAAGSVIANNIPPDSVVAGNPAKVVATLRDYLRYQKICMKKYPSFSYEEYCIGSLSREKYSALMEKLNENKAPIGFIVGGYTHEQKRLLK